MNHSLASREASDDSEHAGTTTTVIIIGAGITGIGAAYYLGISNISYTILEASDDLGGVWATHRWHGARCDSEFIKYSFSFKTLLSPYCLQTRDQIHQYLRSVVEDFGISPHIRFNTRVVKAVFDTAKTRWIVHTPPEYLRPNS